VVSQQRSAGLVASVIGGLVLSFAVGQPQARLFADTALRKTDGLRNPPLPLQSFRAYPRQQVYVNFLPGKVDGWHVAESDNFRLLHNQPHKLVLQVAEVAERTRLTMARKWFGEEPDQWDPKCTVYMHANRLGYTLITKDGGASEGCTMVRMDGREVDSRRIHLHCDADNLLDEILPHEVTHAVMGGNFGAHQTPRWADEGMAILSQPRPSIEHYLAMLSVYRAQNDLFSLEVLMQTDDIKQQNTLEFYSQSVSLVEYLVSLGGPQTFTRFLWDSFKTDYETALKRHYGLAGFAELEKRWLQYAFHQSPPPEGVARFKGIPARLRSDP